MKLISLHESDWKLAKIDSLVEEGVFSSKTEVYRSGALVMILMNEAHKLSKLDRLDSDLFGRDVSLCIKALENKKYELVSENLKRISETLRIRAVISPLLDKYTEKETFEHTSTAFEKYADVIKKYEEYDETTQKRILEDLKRDLSALRSFLEYKEEEIIEKAKEPIVRQPSIASSYRFIKRMQKRSKIKRVYQHQERKIKSFIESEPRSRIDYLEV